MEIREMEAIVALCDAGSLEGGAKALGISPSALSRTINKLSAETGCPLFQRGRKLTLTPAGEICLSYARKIVAVRDQTYRILHAMAGIQQRFSIGMAPHFDTHMFIAIFEQFQGMYPTVRIDVTETYSRDAIELLMQNKLDIAVGIQDDEIIQKTGIVFLPVQKVEYLIAVAQTNVLAEGGAKSGEQAIRLPKRSLADFHNVPYIDSDPRALYHRSVQKMFLNAGCEPQRVNRSGSIPIVRAMMLNYNAFSICPLDYAEDVEYLRYFRIDPPMIQIKGFYLRRDYRINSCVYDFLMLYAKQLQQGYLYSAKLYPTSFTIPEFLRENSKPAAVKDVSNL